MPFVAEVGEGVETSGEVTFEWKLRDFFSLSDKTDDCYTSPVFSFADARWYLNLYPNGDTRYSSTEHMSLYLFRADSGPLKTVYFTFSIKNPENDQAKEETQFSFQKAVNSGYGYPNFILRSKLQAQASRLMPDEILTIVCRLKCSDPNAVKVSWNNRIRKVSRNMKAILNEGKRSDFTLKLGNREWPVHKVILESRCEYFANMFRHDWVENTEVKVEFEDLEEHTLDNILSFLYTGDVEGMSNDTVCKIYIAAHRFLLEDLKVLCIEYMRGNMCVALVSEALVIADTYNEEDLKESAIEYFMREACKIFDSKEWKELKKDQSSIATELLEETTKRGMQMGAK